ncbi:GNAT family N-acetyltransferase [Leisingera aquaemixtae]|uniref:GNAT family N-acetyltransferase n=1 Tax=Leisingera aquaemixtae TaxID=1396826 RepID=UPI0021A8FDDB|nr:N-acetyltransferase [Leisingera aquaemixtae]
MLPATASQQVQERRMEFLSEYRGHTREIIGLFRAAFTASEGEAEGGLIAGLVRDIFAKTPDQDLFVFSAWDGSTLTGCIMFSRLRFDQDSRTVFLLSPVAVSPSRQRQGIGQALLKHGLSRIREHGVDVAVTYGDPAYYGKTGFRQITEAQAAAPVPLRVPEGWLAQPLSGAELAPLRGPSSCIEALNNPDYW